MSVDKEAVRAHIEAIGQDAFVEQQRAHVLARMDTFTPEQRATGAKLWVEGMERIVALTVRCMEPTPKGRPCSEKMAMLWTTPFGYWIDTRLPVSHDRTVHGLGMAVDAREEGDLAMATFAEACVEVPAIVSFLLDQWGDGPADVPLGCKRRHGTALVPAAVLLAEAASTRRVLNVRPSEQRPPG